MATVTITHAKVTSGTVNADVEVDLSDWNDDHVVTGLENVDNTSDANKPVSTATQTALDLKQNLDATLTALAALNSTAGLLTQTGADAFTKTVPGTGVLTALGVNVGSAGAVVVNGGALGTPSSGTLTSATGLPISTGVSGLGTGIATALAVNTGSAGAPVLFNGAGGTPSSITLTNASGTASSLTAGIATNTAITDDTSTSATMYPTWVTASTGNLPQKVSSTKLYFNPSTPRLTVSRNATAWAAAGTTGMHIAGGDTGEARGELTAANSDSVWVFGRMNGTFASPTPLAANDQILGLVGTGIDTAASTTMQQGGSIGGYASQIWTSAHHGYYWKIDGINDDTTALVNFMTLKNQKAGFGKETDPQFGIVHSKNATAGIADPFGFDNFGLVGADSGGAVGFSMIAFGSNPTSNMYRYNGTNAAKTALSSGNTVGGFGFFGYAGSTSGFSGGGGVQAIANQTHSTGNGGTRIEIYATPDASITAATVATFYGSRGLFIGASPSDPGAGAISSAGAIKALDATAIPAGGTAGSGFKFSSTSNFGIFFGSGAPSLAAAKGSLYLRSDGSSTSTRMYVNTDGSTAWTNVTTAA